MADDGAVVVVADDRGGLGIVAVGVALRPVENNESLKIDEATKRNYNKYTMKLEWDADKAVRNLNKHGVSFEDAELVFYDSGRIEAYDGREDYGEDRWATIGLAYSAVLYVVYTVRHEEIIRLISARKANANERKQYREANS